MSERIVGPDRQDRVRLDGPPSGVSSDEHSSDLALVRPRRRPEFVAAAGRLVVRAAGREFDLGGLAGGVGAGPRAGSVDGLPRAHAGPAVRPAAANGRAAGGAPVAGGRS